MVLFDSPDMMIRNNGSEYSEKHSIRRLIGSPPGYIGNDQGDQLIEFIRRKLIEKACREFIMLFLQVLDDGRLTDGQGAVVDFCNTVIIMTSNIGYICLNGNGEGDIKSEVRKLVMDTIAGTWPLDDDYDDLQIEEMD